MKSIFFLAISFIYFSSVFGQTLENEIIQKNEGVAEFRGSWAPETQNNPFQTGVVRLNKGHSFDPEVKAKKQEINELKFKGKFRKDTAEIVLSKNPRILTSFLGNDFDGCTPPDNAIAVNRSGVVVSFINCNLEIFSSTGTSLLSRDLDVFFSLSTKFMYDPKVVYDNNADRFIAVCLEGSTPSESFVHIAYSQSNNPTGNWNFYRLSGNVLNNSLWFDFPHVGLSNSELFITGNLFNTSDVFDQAVILQVDKQNGYNGVSVGYTTWSNFGVTPFSAFAIKPLTDALAKPTGNNMNFVSTRSSGSQRIRLYQINTTRNNNPTLQFFNVLLSSSYAVPGDGVQPDPNVALDAGDCRTLDGFVNGDTAHFVFNAESKTQSGYLGVGYVKLNLINRNTKFKVFSLNNNDIGYASVASATNSTTDQSAVVMAQRTSKNTFNEMVSFIVDKGFVGGTVTTLKAGTSSVDFAESNGISRWGDYTAVQRHFGASGIEFFAGGHFGQRITTTVPNRNVHSNQIVRFDLSGTSDLQVLEEDNSQMLVYPNPAVEKFMVEFELKEKTYLKVYITDMKGSLTTILKEATFKPGKQYIEFSTLPLARGAYQVILETKDGILITKKLVVGS